MSELARAINDLVIANRILANEHVLDAFGHVSRRHPEDPQRFLLSRSRSPELVGHEDILEFTLDGRPTRPDAPEPYAERFIHGAIYEARPEIQAVVHSHAQAVLPFSISSVPFRPVIHTASLCGCDIPVWDIREHFGDTKLLVLTIDQGRDLAKALDSGSGNAILMRGHGFAAAAKSLIDVVKLSVYLPQNAWVLLEALKLGGDIKCLSAGEIAQRATMDSLGNDRIWECWATRAGCGELLANAAPR